MKNSFFNIMAKKYLRELGNYDPQPEHFSKMESLLENTFIERRIHLEDRLTSKEKICLLLAAHGKTSIQTAIILNISKDTVESHRKEIRRKLGCNSMAHAVYQGVRYGYVQNP